MINDRYIISENISFTPNTLTIYDKFYRNQNYNGKAPSFSKSVPDHDRSNAPQADNKFHGISNRHNFELSKQAQKNLRKKVTWLYHLARKKTITTTKGKVLQNFKMNFATLKLPSEQIHSSDFITKNCLNQLFIEINKKYAFQNYVWRLEYQLNGNLHYHFATDVYIDFYFLQKTWNRILNKYGYVDLYTRKFAQMSLSDYNRATNSNGAVEFDIIAKRYAKGCREKWENPNSVDVKAVFGQNNIAYYISKYMSKKEENSKQKKLPVCEDNSKNSRLWFCSRSLSQLDTIADNRHAFDHDIFGKLNACEGVYKYIGEYATTIYFDMSKILPDVRKMLNHYFYRYMDQQNYVPS